MTCAAPDHPGRPSPSRPHGNDRDPRPAAGPRHGVRLRPRGPHPQPEERRRRHPAGRPGRVHRRVRVGQVVAGVRHPLRRGPAALPRVRRPVRPPAVPPARRARRWTRSTACRRPSPSSSSAAPRPPGRRSAASPPCRTCCGCSTPGPATTRRASRSCTPSRSPRTRRRGRARPATGSAGCTTPPRRRWSATTRSRIREGAVAAWPGAWQGQNLRDILTALGIDIDTPWRDLPKKDRDWILFTDEQPQVPVYPHYSLEEVRRAQKRKEPHDYLGTFVGARRYVLETFAKTESAMMKRRVAQFLVSADCPACRGKRLRPEPLSVTFAGLDITEMSRQPLQAAGGHLPPVRRRAAPGGRVRGRPPGEGRGRPADRRGPGGPAGRPARPRARLPDARAQHADALAGRAPAAAAGDAGAVEPVRRRVRPRRAVRRAAPGRHRGPAAGARPAQGGRATRCSSSSTSWT